MAPMNNSPLNTLVAEEEEAVLSDSSVTPMSTPWQARMTRKVACGGRTGALLTITAMAGALVFFWRSHAQRPPIRVRGAVSLGEGLIVRNEYQKGCMIPFGAGTCSSELGSMMRTESMPVGLTCCQAFSLILLQNQDCVACNLDGSDMCFGACGQTTPSPKPADVGPTRVSPAPTAAAAATPSPALATKNPTPAPQPAAAPPQAPAAAPTEIPTLASPTASPTPPPTTPSSRTPSPTASPLPSPTTASPTTSPTPPPTTPSSRTPSPTASPTPSPTTASPTASPTPPPTTPSSRTPSPTASPTQSPTTASPTASPTPSPTTASPTASPTPSPTTASPTASPTPSPTTASPTASPTPSPTTASPTASPTPPPTTPSSRTPSPTASPAQSPTTETQTTTTCAPCQWPAGTLDHSVITHGNALINAKNIYTEMTIGGDLSSTTSENKRVGGEATVGGTYSSTGWTFEQGVTQAPFSSVFDWSDFEDLATRLEEGVYYIGDTNYYVFVRETGGEFHLFDFHDINDPSPLNQGENNGRTLVVFNTHESVTLKADPDFGRKFGPTVLAPFSTVTKDASSDFIDGILIAKEAIVPDGDTQMHGDPYRGPLKCSCG